MNIIIFKDVYIITAIMVLFVIVAIYDYDLLEAFLH